MFIIIPSHTQSSMMVGFVLWESKSCLFPLRFFNSLSLAEVPLVLCVPCFLTFHSITVLLLPGIADEKAAAMMAANQDPIAAPVI